MNCAMSWYPSTKNGRWRKFWKPAANITGPTAVFRKITFEYVMLRDVNDSLDDAKEMVRLLKGIRAKINLIPFNPWPGSKYFMQH